MKTCWSNLKLSQSKQNWLLTWELSNCGNVSCSLLLMVWSDWWWDLLVWDHHLPRNYNSQLCQRLSHDPCFQTYSSQHQSLQSITRVIKKQCYISKALRWATNFVLRKGLNFTHLLYTLLYLFFLYRKRQGIQYSAMWAGYRWLWYRDGSSRSYSDSRNTICWLHPSSFWPGIMIRILH